jgi:hypothetical protein
MTEISPLTTTEVTTGTLYPDEIFSNMSSLLQILLNKTTPEELLETITEDAMLKPDKLKLFSNLNEIHSMPLSKLVPLQLLSQRLKPLLRPNTMGFKFVYTKMRNQLQNVKVVEDKEYSRQNVAIANSVEFSKSLYELMSIIDNKFVAYDNLLKNIKQNIVFLNENMASDKLLKVLKYLGQEYFVLELTALKIVYQRCLSGISLTNVYARLKKLSNLMKDIEQYDYIFSTINAAIHIMRVITTNKVKTIPENETWINCVETLLPSQEDLQTENGVDIALNVLYNYMVGYYILNDMCKEVKDFSLTTLLTKLQKTKNNDHEAVFAELLTQLTLLCKLQTKYEPRVNVSCKNRMEQASLIMNQIARLCKMLYTWKIPEDTEELSVVPSSAWDMILFISILAEDYLTKYVPEYIPESTLLHKIPSYIPSAQTLAFLTMAGVATADLQEEGQQSIPNWNSFYVNGPVKVETQLPLNATVFSDGISGGGSRYRKRKALLY